jgi:hypothetical protein
MPVPRERADGEHVPTFSDCGPLRLDGLPAALSMSDVAVELRNAREVSTPTDTSIWLDPLPRGIRRSSALRSQSRFMSFLTAREPQVRSQA